MTHLAVCANDRSFRIAVPAVGGGSGAHHTQRRRQKGPAGWAERRRHSPLNELRSFAAASGGTYEFKYRFGAGMPFRGLPGLCRLLLAVPPRLPADMLARTRG